MSECLVDGCRVVYLAVVFGAVGGRVESCHVYFFTNICLLYFKSEGWWLVRSTDLCLKK